MQVQEIAKLLFISIKLRQAFFFFFLQLINFFFVCERLIIPWLYQTSLERFSNWDFLFLNHFSTDRQLESIDGFYVCKLGRERRGT